MLVLAAGLWVSGVRADTIYLKNGSQIVGRIVREEAGEVVIEVGSGEIRVAKDEIERVEEDPTPSPTLTLTPSPTVLPETEVREEYPEPAASGTPSPSPGVSVSPAQEFSIHPFDEWYTAWHPNVTSESSGYLHRAVTRNENGTITLKTEEVLLAPDRKPRVQFSETIVLDRDAVPRSFSVLQSERIFYQSSEGAVSADYAQATVTVRDETKEVQAAFPKGALLGELPLMNFLQTASLETGRGSYKSFDFMLLAPVTVRIKAVEWEEIETAEGNVRTLVLEMRVERRAATIKEYRLWVLPRSSRNPSGKVVKLEGGTFGYTYEIATEEEARANTEKWLELYEKVLNTIGRRPPWYKEKFGAREGGSPSAVPSPSPEAE